MPTPEDYRPYTLVAELTYRCPLRCVYCSNPVQRTAAAQPELARERWQELLREAEALGVMQVHWTGGEPLLRPELEELVSSARGLGLYNSLITSALGLTRERLAELARRGLDHVRISIQGTSDSDALRIAGRVGLAHKLTSMGWVRELGLPLTLNVVLHRENIDQLDELIDLGVRVGAERIELANTQFLGWALENRAALLPTAAQIDRARQRAARARERLRGKVELLFVLPDYQADVVRPCMQGWARRYIVVSPDGLILPCHQAHTLPGLAWERVGERSLRDIWRSNPGLEAFRGEAWMPSTCRSCERRTQDFGGCRCQAFHLTGRLDAVDPACTLSPDHTLIRSARAHAEEALASSTLATPSAPIPLRYRRVPREV